MLGSNLQWGRDRHRKVGSRCIECIIIPIFSKRTPGSKEEELRAKEEDFMESLSDKDEVAHHDTQYNIPDPYDPCLDNQCDPLFYDCSTCTQLQQ